MRDEPLKKCPKCKKAALKRLVGGGAGLIFKGTGFYITDYKNKSGKPEGGGDKTAAEKKGGGEGKSADSKPSTSDAKTASSSSTSTKSSSDGAKK
jgi:predicted nucleic acid-binding Zn ribbon protein